MRDSFLQMRSISPSKQGSLQLMNSFLCRPTIAVPPLYNESIVRWVPEAILIFMHIYIVICIFIYICSYVYIPTFIYHLLDRFSEIVLQNPLSLTAIVCGYALLMLFLSRSVMPSLVKFLPHHLYNYILCLSCVYIEMYSIYLYIFVRPCFLGRA